MNPRMTTPAQRHQVFQSVVSGFLGRGHAVAVHVVNVQIVFAAAVLACVLVALQSGLAVAAEVVVVACLVSVLFQPLLVRSKPLMDAANFCLALASWAAVLWARLVLKVVTAFRAHQDRSDRSYATRFTQSPQVLDVLQSAVFGFAGFAHLLAGTGRCVLGAAHGALAGVVRHIRLQSRNIRIVT